MSRKIRTLLFSTLYPSSTRPVHGVFVETRLRELLKSDAVETKVVAPVPWFPSSNPRFGTYAQMAATPLSETRNGVEIHHPRYFLPPRIGQNVAPFMLAAGALPTVRRLIRQGFDFDLIDAHYFYPDGVAAAIVAQSVGKPFVVTARGSDVTLLSQFAIPNRLIKWVTQKASANIGVCRDLVSQLEALGAEPTKSQVLRNGVDLERFQPVDRQVARERLGLPSDGLLLITVGHLVEQKGHQFAIRLLARMPGVRLVIVGGGMLRDELMRLAQSEGVSDRVNFAGIQPPDELKYYFSAADILLLASSREGWANVLLESMACGTPVVATAVNGTPEVVADPTAGRLANERTVESLHAAVVDLMADMPTRGAVRQYAERFSWDQTTQGQLNLFNNVLQTSAR